MTFFVDSARNWIGQWQRWGFDEDGFHPWDNNPVYYAAYPEQFSCAEAEMAMVVACAGGPNHDAADNLCAGNGPNQPASLDKEGSQLWLGDAQACRRDDGDCQDEVTSYRGGTVCTAYADEGIKAGFLDAVFTFLGEPE